MTTKKVTEENAHVPSLTELMKPSYEPVLLPSRGILYDKSWTDKNGRISVRPMTVAEEKILATVRLVKTGKAIDMIIRNCLEQKDIDTGELLSGDRSFLLYHLRNVSYGALYSFKVTCQRCGEQFPVDVNLNEIKIKYLEEGFAEPCETQLPITKARVEFRLMRGKDEIALLADRSRRMSQFGPDQIDNTLSERYKRQIISIQGVEDKAQIEPFINQLVAGDSSFLRDEIDRRTCGIEFSMKCTCSSCGAENESEVPITSDFFRISKR